MQLTKQLIGLVPLTLILLGLLSYNFMSAQWTGPSATAPGNNATAPINISNNYQAKLGDLGAVRMRAGEYCDAAGLNCFTATSTGSGGGGGETITVGGQCFEPAIAVNCWWNWSGTGNDTATYFVHKNANPNSYCASIGRGYGSHVTVLAQCGVTAGAIAWQPSAWGACTPYTAIQCGSQGQNCHQVTLLRQTRTLSCVNNATGAILPNSACSAFPPPAATQSC